MDTNLSCQFLSLPLLLDMKAKLRLSGYFGIPLFFWTEIICFLLETECHKLPLCTMFLLDPQENPLVSICLHIIQQGKESIG